MSKSKKKTEEADSALQVPTFPYEEEKAPEPPKNSESPGKVSKTEMVKEALKALSEEAPAKKLQEWIQAQYGIEINLPMISNYKSTILRKSRGEVTPKAPKMNSNHSEVIQLEDMKKILELSTRLGKEKLKSIVEML